VGERRGEEALLVVVTDNLLGGKLGGRLATFDLRLDAR
jgi:hypothetical protein